MTDRSEMTPCATCCRPAALLIRAPDGREWWTCMGHGETVPAQMTPKRIQRRRVKGWRMPPGAVYVGRGSRWGNPYKIAEELSSIPFVDADYPARHFRTREEAVSCFRELLTGPHFDQTILHTHWIEPLRGKDLVCWCPLDRACHADVLLEITNA